MRSIRTPPPPGCCSHTHSHVASRRHTAFTNRAHYSSTPPPPPSLDTYSSACTELGGLTSLAAGDQPSWLHRRVRLPICGFFYFARCLAARRSDLEMSRESEGQGRLGRLKVSPWRSSCSRRGRAGCDRCMHAGMGEGKASCSVDLDAEEAGSRLKIEYVCSAD